MLPWKFNSGRENTFSAMLHIGPCLYCDHRIPKLLHHFSWKQIIQPMKCTKQANTNNSSSANYAYLLAVNTVPASLSQPSLPLWICLPPNTKGVSYTLFVSARRWIFNDYDESVKENHRLNAFSSAVLSITFTSRWKELLIFSFESLHPETNNSVWYQRDQ